MTTRTIKASKRYQIGTFIQMQDRFLEVLNRNHLQSLANEHRRTKKALQWEVLKGELNIRQAIWLIDSRCSPMCSKWMKICRTTLSMATILLKRLWTLEYRAVTWECLKESKPNRNNNKSIWISRWPLTEGQTTREFTREDPANKTSWRRYLRAWKEVSQWMWLPRWRLWSIRKSKIMIALKSCQTSESQGYLKDLKKIDN